MSDLTPDYWGNIIYESAMGLYCSEQEAKDESWRGEHFFPLYEKETVEKLQEELSKYKKYFASNVMIPTEEYGAIIDKHQELKQQNLRLSSENEIYRKSNDIYKKALEEIVGCEYEAYQKKKNIVETSKRALQDAQKLAGGK